MRLHLYSRGRPTIELCPEHLQGEWNTTIERISAHHRSFLEAKMSLEGQPLKQLLPEKIFLKYQELRGDVERHILKNYEQPENYDFLCELDDLVSEISQQELNIDVMGIRPTPENRDFLKKVRKIKPQISYNIFGTKTGRLTTNPGSFPILTLKKENRSVLKPQKDCFLEMDFNAFELRVLLSLLDKEQPEGDIHEWNVKNIYQGSVTRAQAKKRIFAWLYNPNSDDKLTSRYYDRGQVKDRFFSRDKIKTIFNREIESDDYHAFNYIMQSTASDLFLQQAIKIQNMIEESNIAFLMHDSLTLDFDKSELGSINEIRENFSQTIFGDFPISIKIGKNFGEMKEWKL